jgi:hypothetical protein
MDLSRGLGDVYKRQDPNIAGKNFRFRIVSSNN